VGLAYIVDGGLNDPPGTGTELYQSFEAVRRVYAQAAEWTGVPVQRLLQWRLDRPAEHRDAGAIRQAAVALGICDVLAERGVRPEMVAGMSLGAMVGATIAGAIARQDLFRLLGRLRAVPKPDGPPQGVAALFVPVGTGVEEFTGGFPEHVHLAADMGLVGGGQARMLLLSGYRHALESLHRRVPADSMRVPPDLTTAYHSPLSAHIVAFLEPVIADMPIADPVIGLCCGMEPAVLTTAEQVRTMIRANYTHSVSLRTLFDALDGHGTELAFLIGPAQADLFIQAAPHGIVHIDKPEHLPEALAALHDFGLHLARH
jgi:[acyl-carrier-protein] S-malonyltransferase